MQYRKMGKLGWEVSALGFGAMRLPTIKIADKDVIQEEEAIRMIRYAIDHGVNYIDTAWPYHNQTSENLVGKALQDGYREKVKLVTKLPMWEIKETADFEKFLTEQLKRLQTDYLDIYLFHALSEQRWKTVKDHHLISEMEKAKTMGKIKHFGFSFHDSITLFKEIIDAYNWDVCQIQYNYLDQEYQAGKEGLQYATAKDVAVIIMEPLRGGKLTQSSPELDMILDNALVHRKLADWGLQFLWNQPEVTVVLSGMSTMEQVQENLASAAHSGINRLSPPEVATIDLLREEYQKKIVVPCTQCKYCMPCPAGVDIPGNLNLYNNYKWSGSNPFLINVYRNKAKNSEELKSNPNNGRATLCVECGACLEQCPQHINIPEELKHVAEIYEKLIN